MTIIEKIKQKLMIDPLASCKRVFPSNYKIEGSYFRVGSIKGEPGSSFAINLQSGVWKDHATSESGNLFDLYVATYGSTERAINECCSIFGIPRNKKSSFDEKKQNTRSKEKLWRKPNIESCDDHLNEGCTKYLLQERRISLKEINKVNRSKELLSKGTKIVFVSYFNDEPCGSMSIDFVNKNDKGKKIISQSKDPKQSLWGIKSLTEKRDILYITEGQIDCLSMRSAGIANCVSIPSGANSTDWVDTNWDLLQTFDRYVIIPDNDEVGISAAESLSKRLGTSKTDFFYLDSKYKDPNEILKERGYEINIFDFGKIEEYVPDKLASIYELSEESWLRAKKGDRGEQGIPFCGWVNESTINFKVRPKELTIVTGYPHSGKSTTLYQHAAYLAFHPDLNEPSLIASLEEDSEDMVNIIISQAMGRAINPASDKDLYFYLTEIVKKRIFFYNHRGQANIDDLLETAEHSILRHGVKHFFLDSIMKTNLDIEDNKEANKFIEKITNSMNETGAHYYIVAHARKGNDRDLAERPTMQSIKGAAAISGQAFNILSLWRNVVRDSMLKAFEEGRFQVNQNGEYRTRGNNVINKQALQYEQGDSIIDVVKQKVSGKIGSFQLWFDYNSKRLKRSYNEELIPYYNEEAYKQSIEMPF